jgi:hydrogenase maturation protease
MREEVGILVVTCGNALAGDDGVGPRVAQVLRENPIEGVHLIDAALDPSVMLLHHLRDHRRLIVVDAILDASRPCGEVIDVDWFTPDRPDLLHDRRAVSSHAWSVGHQIDLAQAMGALPDQVRLLGVCIHRPRLGMQSTPAVGRGVESVYERIRESAEHLATEEANHDECI